MKFTSSKRLILFDIDYTLFDTDTLKKTKLRKHVLYKEVREVLKKLSKLASLGIFSEGDLDFQKTKLLKTDIKDYFEKDSIHIMAKKDDEMQKTIAKYKDKTLFLVDDKLDILYKTKRLFPSIFTVWVKRGKYAKSQKSIYGFEPDAAIKTLQEVIPVVSA